MQIDREGQSHWVQMFPAIIREENTNASQSDGLGETGATCFFHENVPAVAICEESGRMICAMCKTEWEGRIVSFQALQEIVSNNGKKDKEPFRWDRLASYLIFMPIVFIVSIPFTILTAPLAAIICLIQMVKPSQKARVPVSRVRYGIYLALALIVCAVWGYFLMEGDL